MERKKTVEEIISALETLRLHEAVLTAELGEAIKERRHEVASCEDTAPIKPETRDRKHKFVKGDRVIIKNKLHKPAFWDDNTEWCESEGKTATVTEVLLRGPTEQVHFITDNGVHTWRAPNNLRLLAPFNLCDE
jgi:hypothetical protein